ncbi:hypothetical protein GLP30_17095 [Photobacterium phosphoreum]|uniref:Lipoprotein n=1 Tax=Photobacterium phosphoreum TaxID=659 RepID=A0AAW5A4I1_PHOPO|nr:hypothetical protein [Photobacterium phosphoreum]MCD9492630.1 hypothetical protein [Photobacterium phosphoreum]MCF2191805.1 hypothetical protein [Photobacterium phosphoreum]MCF2303461.1 hypothetical protein [Photobacterium phosphoreum]
MKKIIVLLMISVFGMTVLSGCGDSAAEKAKQEQIKKDKEFKEFKDKLLEDNF